MIPPQAIVALELLISTEEIAAVGSSMKPWKSPGPDGFTLYYYRLLADRLYPQLAAAYNSIPGGGAFSRDSLLTHIAVIPKVGKDLSSCANYRPISLLNIDLKILTKILAQRVAPYIVLLIDLNQVGFLPHREVRDNTIMAINLVTLASSSC